jgi:hypothetical protein
MRRASDEALLRRVAPTLADPAPPRVEHIGRLLFTWRTVDGELAELLLKAECNRPAAPVRANGACAHMSHPPTRKC